MNMTTDLGQIRVLIVDDEADIRLGLSKLMKSIGVHAAEASSGKDALSWLQENDADIVLTDLMMPGMSGAELLTEIKHLFPEMPVVILTAFGTIQTAVSCLQNGAAHFLTKPFDNKNVQQIVKNLSLHVLASKGRSSIEETPSDQKIIAEDPRMKRVYALVSRVSRSPAPVLIEGPSGAGKEVVARTLHRQSSVSELPFLPVNAAALTDTLLESELFGHRRGAFTGADRDHKGLFEEARGGTVFLDEVASMSSAFQGKLLRVLQEREVRPVGNATNIQVDFRLIAATNRDLSQLVRQGKFREDLYYRLRVVSIPVPALRERSLDIHPLAMLFLARAASLCLPTGSPLPQLSQDALDALLSHPWPGNVRELENAIQRAVIVCGSSVIHPHHLGLIERSWETTSSSTADQDYGEAKKKMVEKFQREFVQRALEGTGGNVSKAAQSCGLTRAAFQKILRQHGIDRKAFEPSHSSIDHS